MQLQGQVGEVQQAKGVPAIARVGNLSDLIVSELNGRYYENTLYGRTYSASTALVGVTMAAGMASPVGAAATVMLAIFNPVSSGTNLIILRGKVWTVSGTPAGPFAWNVIANPAGITAAGAAPMNQKTFLAQGSVAKAFANAALTGGLAASMLSVIGGPAAIAGGVGVYSVTEETAGSIIVIPGACLIVAPTGAGTTHIAGASIEWAEVPVV